MRWATVAPNYEYGQSAVKWFRQLLLARRPEVEFVGEQWPALGRIDAGATVQALAGLRPDNIFNVLFGADLTNFVRQGNTRALFDGRRVVSVLTGEPEYLDALADETPDGWIVTGYPASARNEPPNKPFADAFRAKFKAPPMMGSVVGHALVSGIVAGILKSGGTGAEAMADGFKGARFDTPFGPASWRAIDNQSTLGTYLGTLALRGGVGVMENARYVDGGSVLPSDEQVRKLRPG